jgi:hypothetical protein
LIGVAAPDIVDFAISHSEDEESTVRVLEMGKVCELPLVYCPPPDCPPEREYQVRQQLLFGHVGNTNSFAFRALVLLPLWVFEKYWNHETAPDFPHVADKD